MEKDKIVNILKKPQQINNEDVKILEKWVSQYPYFQSAHILIAKLAYDNKTPNKEVKLNYAAIYSPNRGVLKHIILNDLSKIPEHSAPQLPSSNEFNQPPEAKQDYPSFNEPISKDWQEKNEHFNKNLKDEYLIKKDNYEVNQSQEKEDEIPVPKVNQQLVDEVLANLEKAQKLKKEYLDKEEDDSPESNSAPESNEVKITETANEDQSSAEEENDDTQTNGGGNLSVAKDKDLIDTFIENEKNIGKIKPKEQEEPQVDLSEKSTSLADDMISENLASILQKQGKNEKAIDIYKKLIWKFPQKRAYFASLIEELKNN